MSNLAWQKSTYSGETANCVYVAVGTTAPSSFARATTPVPF
ncbi:DUF397 domain-containing protein [Streptomyces sp. ICN903]|nr:DUF397 domain-containing protein [Streptomyces sp. ICN903]